MTKTHECDAARYFLCGLGMTGDSATAAMPFIEEGAAYWNLPWPGRRPGQAIIYCPYCGVPLPDPVDGLPLPKELRVIYTPEGRDALTPS